MGPIYFNYWKLMDVYLIFRIDLIQESGSEWEHIFVELRKLEIAI